MCSGVFVLLLGRLAGSCRLQDGVSFLGCSVCSCGLMVSIHVRPVLWCRMHRLASSLGGRILCAVAHVVSLHVLVLRRDALDWAASKALSEGGFARF